MGAAGFIHVTLNQEMRSLGWLQASCVERQPAIGEME